MIKKSNYWSYLFQEDFQPISAKWCFQKKSWFRYGFYVVWYTSINLEKQHLVLPKRSPHKKNQLYFGFLLYHLGPLSPYIFVPVWGNLFLTLFQVGKNSSKSLVFVNPPPPPHPFLGKFPNLNWKKFLKRFGLGYLPFISLIMSKFKLKINFFRFGHPKLIQKLVFIC